MCTRKPHTHTHHTHHTLTCPHTPIHLHTPPHTHPHSGGTNYTITGTDLNSVQQPRLLFYVDSAAGEGRTRRQTAGQNMNYIQSEVSMECGSCKPCIFLYNAVIFAYMSIFRIYKYEGNRTSPSLNFYGICNVCVVVYMHKLFPHPCLLPLFPSSPPSPAQ